MLSFPKWCAHCGEKWALNHVCRPNLFTQTLDRLAKQAKEREVVKGPPGPVTSSEELVRAAKLGSGA